jgi:hypothetical protein
MKKIPEYCVTNEADYLNRREKPTQTFILWNNSTLMNTHILTPHRTAPHRTAPHRTAPHRTAPHRTAPQFSNN